MKKNYVVLFGLVFFITACDAEIQQSFICSNTKNQSVKFAFSEKQILIDGLVFNQQKWIARKTIRPDLVRLIWRQKTMLPAPNAATKKNNFYDAQIVRDYQFNPIKKTLSFASYLQDVPQEITLAREKEIKFTCQKLNLIYPVLKLLEGII